MTEKNIFAYKLFLSLNISDFNLFYVEIATPLKKVTPLEMLRSFQAPLFANLVGGPTPPPPPPGRKGGGESVPTMCVL